MMRRVEDEAAVGRVAPRAPGGELLSVGRAEERVEPAARRAGADAEQRGHDEGHEGAAELGAAGEVLGVLLGAPRRAVTRRGVPWCSTKRSLRTQ